MSTKTTIKRLALVTVAALGLGVMSVAPSSAAPSGDTLALSAATATVTSGTAATVTVTQTFLAESGDTMTVTAGLIAFPANNTAQPAWTSLAVVSTDVGSANVDTATARVAKIGSVVGFVNKSLTLSFTGTVAGTYVIRVTPAISNPANLTPVATAKDFTITVAAKTVAKSTAFISAGVGANETPTADATISTTALASATAKARITVANFYDATALETATAADGQSVVVATDKGLVSKTNDYIPGAKSVTTTAATAAASNYWVFSNGDVGAASVTITVNGVLLATKTVTFIGAAASLATPTTISATAPLWATLGTDTSTVITAKDSAGGAVGSLPAGLTVKSSDTTVATVTISSGTVTVKPVAAGNATITVTDPATSAAATAVTFPVRVAPIKSKVAPVISFDKTAYNVGELVTMTITSDMGDKAAAVLFTAALVASATVVADGTAHTGATHQMVGGKVTYKFYAPAVSGTWTVTGTTGSDVDLATAATVTKTIDIVNAGVDAATAAAELAEAAAQDATDAALDATEAATLAGALAQEAVDAVAELAANVTKLFTALDAQITKLTNLILKIGTSVAKIAAKK